MTAWLHSSLAVETLPAAISFFEKAFGFSVVFREDGMAGQIQSMTGIPGITCDLVQLRHPSTGHVLELIAFHLPPAVAADRIPVRPGGSHAAFRVEDLQTARAAIEALGAETLGDVTSFENGPALYARVPGGAFIELEQQVRK